MYRLLKLTTLLLCLFLSTQSYAQDFVYQFRSPAFGGNPLNNFMLNAAQLQNDFQEESTSRDRFERDPLRDFEESLNRQVLSQISRQLIRDQFGEASLEEGQYEIGNYLIDVVPAADGVQITILDEATGSETTVTVPYF
jgi:curli production assembly/transport component CsgF